MTLGRDVEPESRDRVTRLIERANRLLESSPDHADVERLASDLISLPPRELARFDAQSRSWYSGLQKEAIKRLRWPVLRGARKPLWEMLGLVSSDGHERERAINAARLSSITVRLLALRCTDWVSEVRTAALRRLANAAPDLLVSALALAQQLATERERGGELEALLDARLSDDDLRRATGAADALIRRAAWRRLAARKAATVEELRSGAARDPDVMVRAAAANALAAFPPAQRRSIAEVLIDDAVGWIARPALHVLVELDGAVAIRRALTARSHALRRAAREWATIRDVDARAVYHERLQGDRGDALAVTALCEISDPRDIALFKAALSDHRSRVRAAAIRAVGRVDRVVGRATAIDALAGDPAGRVTRAAADVLRDDAPNGGEIERLQHIALDEQRPAGVRFRALELLRPARWKHLAVLLEARTRVENDRVAWRLEQELRAWLAGSIRLGKRPPPDVRDRITSLLTTLDTDTRRRIEFILRTTS